MHCEAETSNSKTVAKVRKMWTVIIGPSEVHKPEEQLR